MLLFRVKVQFPTRLEETNQTRPHVIEMMTKGVNISNSVEHAFSTGKEIDGLYRLFANEQMMTSSERLF